MAYDTYLNRATGDWYFSAAGDFLGVTGEEFDRQRIWIRAKIPRGSFIYDKSKTLGSTLYQIPRNPSESQLAAAQSALFTALEGIVGIDVIEITPVLSADESQIGLEVKFSKNDQEVDAFTFQLASANTSQTELAIET